MSKADDCLFELADFVDDFLKDDGKVELAVYQTFFHSMRSPREAAAYLTVLISRIILLETEQGSSVYLADYITSIVDGGSDFEVELDSPIVAWEPSKDETFEKESLVLTIYLLALYYEIETSYSPLVAVISRWKKIYAHNHHIPILRTVLKLLYRERSDGKQKLIDLVEECSNVEFSPDFTTKTLTVDNVSPSLISVYLRHVLHNGSSSSDDTSVIINKVLLFLQYPMLVVEHEERLPPLLHLLRSFISAASYMERSLISRAKEIIEQYVVWPRPYCDEVKELLHLLTMEEKNPGHAFRQQIMQENPELFPEYISTGKERTVHVLLDKASTNGEIAYGILTSESPPSVPLHQLYINLLMHMIRNNCEGTDVWSLELDCCTPEQLTEFFHSACGIIDDAILTSVESASTFRAQKFAALVEAILECPKTGKRESVTMTDKRLIVRPPPLELDVLPVSCETSELPSSFHSKYKYPHRTSADLLLHILKQYSSAASPQDVKIAIMGNDQTLHNIVASYICLKSSSRWEDVFTNVNLLFYFLPVDACHVADYLSRKDPWYGRHVVCLLDCVLRVYPGLNLRPDISRKKTVVWDQSPAQELLKETPETKTSSSAHAASESEIYFSPSQLLRSELQTFIREARHARTMNIFQCECWSPDGSYFTLPFLWRCELGIDAFASHFQILKRLQDVSIREICTTNKDFKNTYAPLHMDIKMTEMNLAGESRQATTPPSMVVHSLVVANVPISRDTGAPADPSKGWLEMHLVEHQKRKRGRELFHHVSVLEATPSRAGRTKSFPMLLDGVLYAPLVKIRISPCTTSHDELHTLNFMSFSPELH